MTIITLFLSYNQVLINEKDYLRGMIEHHQMAILMSEKVLEKNPSKFTKELANNIIKGQKNEIDEMKDELEK